MGWDLADLHPGELPSAEDEGLECSRHREQQVLLLRAGDRGQNRTQKLPYILLQTCLKMVIYALVSNTFGKFGLLFLSRALHLEHFSCSREISLAIDVVFPFSVFLFCFAVFQTLESES